MTQNKKIYSALLFLIPLLSLFFASCSEPTLITDNRDRLNGYIKDYNGRNISSLDVDGALVLDCGSGYYNFGTTEKTYGASTHAVFVDKSNHYNMLNTVGVTFNSVVLDEPYNSGLISAFVPEPAQTANSINWLITNLNAQPFTITDSPLQRIEYSNSLKAGDTLLLSGFSLNYTADTSISEIRVEIIHNRGLAYDELGDTSTARPPIIDLKRPNTGSITLTAADLAGLRPSYYGISLSYRKIEVFNGLGRTILLAKSYDTSIPLILQ